MFAETGAGGARFVLLRLMFRIGHRPQFSGIWQRAPKVSELIRCAAIGNGFAIGMRRDLGVMSVNIAIS
jgi:hypothetical protein